MPRLGATSGNNDESSRRGRPPTHAAGAYPSSRPGRGVSSIIFILAFTLILRNLFFRDYRSEEISYLKSSGKSDEEIAKLVPRTAEDQRVAAAAKISEYEQLKIDVATLKREVKALRGKVSSEEDEEKKNQNAEKNVDTDRNSNVTLLGSDIISNGESSTI